jgi:hypothetical protein
MRKKKEKRECRTLFKVKVDELRNFEIKKRCREVKEKSVL